MKALEFATLATIAHKGLHDAKRQRLAAEEKSISRASSPARDIAATGPRISAPAKTKISLKIKPVERFLERWPSDRVTHVGGPDLELTRADLPAGKPRIIVFEQSR